jgi:hypothetical protein
MWIDTYIYLCVFCLDFFFFIFNCRYRWSRIKNLREVARSDSVQNTEIKNEGGEISKDDRVEEKERMERFLFSFLFFLKKKEKKKEKKIFVVIILIIFGSYQYFFSIVIQKAMNLIIKN